LARLIHKEEKGEKARLIVHDSKGFFSAKKKKVRRNEAHSHHSEGGGKRKQICGGFPPRSKRGAISGEKKNAERFFG